MTRLSFPIKNMRNHYNVIVVGSGYGGAIAASRLARARTSSGEPLSVCILERGKEFQPGEYPDTEMEAVRETQIDTEQGFFGSRTGLYDFRVNENINVVVGCGLGGTSLINANVCLRPERRVLEDPRWPQELRRDLDGDLEEGFHRAEEMFKPVPYPDPPVLPKLQALEKSAADLPGRFYRPPIKVTFEDGVNHVGVRQQACTRCGDCVSGCNYAAKNTLIMNYLPDAGNHGAEIYSCVSVRRIERRDGRWLLHYQLPASGREKFDAPTMFVSADLVILGAGVLGTTEILLRSKENGLPLSDKLGRNFSGNADVLGFGYNNDVVIDGIGWGSHPPEEMKPVGPTITGIIDFRPQSQVEEEVVIEEGAIPGALATFLPELFALASKLVGKETTSRFQDLIMDKEAELDSFVRGAYHGALNRTQTYLVMGHDDAAGRMHLEDDRLRIDWPGVGSQPIFEKINDLLEQATRVLGGTYVENPVWSDLLRHGLVTVHPLGGCVMAEDAEHGVVNHKGQVFSQAQGTAVYENLYVCDGSVLPRSLGVNPLLTISAVAERTVALLARDRGWEIDYRLPSAPGKPSEPARLGIRFTERMAGYFSKGPEDDYQRAAEEGEKDGSSFEFILTIMSDDLEGMLTDERHQAAMVGTVRAPALSAQPLTVANGEFNLFVKDPGRVETRQMQYRMIMTDEGGRSYYFSGFKVIHDDPGLDLWPDTTTLYITVHEGEGPEFPVLGRGILKISPDDFTRQLTTMEVTNASTRMERLSAMARFGRFFTGVLYDTYGGLLTRSSVFNPDAPPRRKRPLRVAAPEVYPFLASDGTLLRLTRYSGGAKGPVLVSHGLGVSSRIFSLDTIDTNLLEYLFAQGYDLWLLDYRASIDLAASARQFTGDDVAIKDYPAAVKKILEVTGAPNLQVVAHCFGSTTFFMAMLAGLEGVRSAAISQIATHMVVPTLTKVKSGLHLPSVLEALRITSLTAYVDTHEDWSGRLYDQFLKLFPLDLKERCHSPVCHRITFMYGLLYQHEQLNGTTHDNLHELFGVANITTMDHLALMARVGRIVKADGTDDYLASLERLAMPITFIHGAENQCFLPQSTEITYNLLREQNGQELYRRHVIPGYGHIDSIFGKNAANDVYPYILDHLEATK